ncbi:DegT/DnrJ/EryC1/StrS aminotransferase family protein [Synechococcus sp. UW105]|uniref:DegT/DnrJ/EryC1/StrS family aminotransferase n=1 Tax=Synechococcus sp. UW105 TaxID=337067 RepID=UPI000E0F8BE4|nr:DegT/DnrJ/EryC1/StrS family aminotransferase [Synechococcus sp. UW105]
MTFKFPLALSTWDSDEINAMKRVIDSRMFTMGNHVEQFEKSFAQYIGSKYCVMSNSGSSANLLMVAALFFTNENPLKQGDEVIVPAVSWSTTYTPLLQYGLKLKFVDIDLETLNYDLDQLANAVSENTRLIMCVNLLGNPNNFSVIESIASNVGAILIEDNCESLGATYKNQKAGSFGIMGSFSSFFSHHISTMEGGLTVTDDEELYHIMKCLRAHGWTRNLPRHNQLCQINDQDPFMESFRFILPGYNLRPLELSGAIGLEQLKKLPKIVLERRENGIKFQRKLQSHPDLLIQKEIGQSSWFGFSLTIRPGSTVRRKDLLDKLNLLGFECRPIVAGNFTRNDVMKYFHAEVPTALPNADHIHNYGLFIGNHHFPLDDAISELSNLSFV